MNKEKCSCEYCSFMVIGDINYCERKGKGLADTTIKNYKKCNMFEFNEISAVDLNKIYKPRISNINENQLKLDLDKGDD